MFRSISRSRLVRPVVATLGVTSAALALTGTGSLGALGAQAAVAARPVAARPVAARAAASAQKWTKISADTGLSIASAGLLRTSDGRLHVAWPSFDRNGTYSLHYSTVGGKAKLLNTGTIFKGWGGISAYPRLVVTSGGGIRLVFAGGNNQGGSPFNLGAMYTATSSSAGTAWTLVNGSMSASTNVPLTDTSAATETNGTPVAAWSVTTALDYHIGVDGNIPSKGPDLSVGAGASGDVTGPTLVRGSDGGIYAAWFNSSGTSSQGYWAVKLLPSPTAKVKAPFSGGTSGGNNQPGRSVAFAARAGGGEYLAYCVLSKTRNCAHIDLWRDGAAKAMVVPGSGTGSAQYAAIAAGRDGHLWVLWYDEGLNKIRIVRTNAAATRFGPVLTIAGPPKLGEMDGLQAESSAGPLDVIALAQQSTNNSTPAYWDTQVLPALTIKASKSSVSNGKAASITFTVTDTGSAVAAATVKFLGASAKTNAKGTAKFTIKKGTAKGNHVATATRTGYAPASFTVKVT
jgi:hypothetical protein